VGARTPSMVSFWELIVQAIQIGVFFGMNSKTEQWGFYKKYSFNAWKLRTM